MNQRMEKMMNWLREQQVDVAFIYAPTNIYYFTHFMCNPHERLLGLFIFPERDPFLICPLLEMREVKNTGWPYTIIGYDDVENPWEMIRAELSKRLQKQVIQMGIEKEKLTYARAEQLKQVIPSAQFVSIDEQLNELRLIKNAEEIHIMREAGKWADYGVEVGISCLKEGITEMEVLAQIELELKKQGIQDMAFSTMVLFGEKTSLPHGHPGRNELKKGDMVLFDLGVKWKGYCSDITRTVAFGSVNEKQREIYETVLNAQLEALKYCKPGTRIGDLDQVARSIIAEAGFGAYFTHRLGHGLGMEVHEYPSLNGTNDQVLQPGMTFTVEPGIYVPEICGVRIEDDVVITQDGHETLTRFPKELQVI
ncbi:M24 family metallopeptidase [Thermoflavimicrobium dichotomicum]|uniref:Xaa-Pro dipeptidase n=1 Tax=Thermoflavimicrobium dichotomicum TaxID=46223 RepID=A0A1I3NN61_9BACL|nr:Xaa-Pro peptidase family protein [Thermoflavimicrobium dichotomicum]SFJ10607.1 Xaa-Pro dipeptidase [Thermoflavimicrobium dichotomicum]